MFDEDGVYDYGIEFDEQQVQNVKDGGLCKECCNNKLRCSGGTTKNVCVDKQCPVYQFRSK